VANTELGGGAKWLGMVSQNGGGYCPAIHTGGDLPNKPNHMLLTTTKCRDEIKTNVIFKAFDMSAKCNILSEFASLLLTFQLLV